MIKVSEFIDIAYIDILIFSTQWHAMAADTK